MVFYRHPENRVYAGELKRGQKGRHLKAGVFIFGGDKVTRQNSATRSGNFLKVLRQMLSILLNQKATKNVCLRIEVLQEAARYCRTADILL